MSTSTTISRRDFVKHAAAGAAGISVVQRAAAADAARPAKRKTKIRIGIRINKEWLHSDNDNDLRFLKQIGVNHVNIELDMVKGYAENASFTKEALRELIDRLGAVGLRIERANTSGDEYLNAYLGRPEGQKEIDRLKKVAGLLAEADVPEMSIQPCMAWQHLTQRNQHQINVYRYFTDERRGYRYFAFDLERAKKLNFKPAYHVTADQLWKGMLNIYRQVVPVLDGSKMRIDCHGNDPPVYELLGNPQIICRYADYDRLFAEVPSMHHGINFCVGTRYESGEDIFEGIRHFAKLGRLIHCHFRNVRGTLPTKGGHAEVFVDDGDIDMPKVLRTLDEVGYDGVIDYDHPMGITGDKPLPKQYIAFAVGYMRGLLQSLPG